MIPNVLPSCPSWARTRTLLIQRESDGLGGGALNSEGPVGLAPEEARNETVAPTIPPTASGTRIQTYFIHAPLAGRVKIGKSRCVKQRFADLSCASPEWLVLLGVLDGDIEAKLHERFGLYRVKGEWFKLAGRLEDFVRDAFPGKLSGDGFVYYTPDYDAYVGGVPGRVTVDYDPDRQPPHRRSND